MSWTKRLITYEKKFASFEPHARPHLHLTYQHCCEATSDGYLLIMTLAANPPIEIPLENLSAAQKWQVFDWLRNDLAVEEIGPQGWHFDILAEREKRLASGEAQLMELDDFITEMRRTMP